MNDEELDLLASAYVDGEATPEEVALVERDPELQARVEAFRAVTVDGSITPPPGLVDRHLAAAIAEFDTGGAGAGAEAADEAGADDAVGGGAAVVDLRDAASRRDETGGTRRASRDRRARTGRTMPSWLPAAAGFVIIGGGFVWAASQLGGGADDADTEAASIAVDDAAEEAESVDEAGEDGQEAMSALADEAMEEEGDDAMAEDATDSESAEDRASTAGADAAAPADADADDEEAAEEDAEADFAIPEPQLFFDEVPDVDAIGDLPDPLPDLERSLCGPEIVTATLGEPIGFVPIEIGNEPAEIFVFRDGDGAEIRVLVDSTCQPIEP